ncbi:hypothetical protein Dsin_028333 [Dipteronia sinensis]|uniref:FAD-binding PCMH-type domain-containing protein n=1 Tax=Dipteronia sinensis TaxID=43782 RepID=A0AAE0DVF9_9ROSI|nr:hypothetical protein Dsin_028333 [Dipteronia sinensis]
MESSYELPFSWAWPDPALDIFLQCLPTHIQPSYPIFESIYTPNNSSFQSILTAYIKNRRFLTAEAPKPLTIVAARHESHVQATVICAKYSDLEIRIRSGGHDYEGLSYISAVPFVILDMFNLRSVDIDTANQTVWVQSGATLGELYYRIWNSSKLLGFPAGGYGNLMRKYGLSVDNVVDAQIVDIQGRILDRKSMGEDLFWAIRGGGGASFGVILSWKIKLVSVPKKVTVFKINKTLEQGATDVVYRWQNVAHSLPEDIFIRAVPSVTKGAREGEKTVVVFFVGLFLGQTQSLIPLMNISFPELGLQVKDCTEMSWVESTLFWADFPVGTSIDILLNRPKEVISFSFKRKSDYIKNVIPKKGLENIWKQMINLDVKISMQWNPYGGKMSEISESETPFPHRTGNLFKIQYLVSWGEEGTNVTNRYINGIRDFYASMASYVSSGPREAFLNYRDIDIGSISSNQTTFKDSQVYGVKYFKGNFQRLVNVKAVVDPDNFFKNEQSIPPAKYQV